MQDFTINTQRSNVFELAPITKKTEEKIRKESVFTIDLHDSNAPPQSVIDSLSDNQQTWLGALLRPLDMAYHICQGAFNKLNEGYQKRLTETLENFEKSVEDVQYELKKVLGKDYCIQLPKLYLNYRKYKEDFEKLEAQETKNRKLVDAIAASDQDVNNNKKQDITPEYSAAQKIMMFDFNQLQSEVQKAKSLYESARYKIDQFIDSLKLTSSSQVMLHILKEATSIRTTLLMQQFAFSSNIPEIPGGYTNAGLQMQIVLPANEVFKKLFFNEPLNDLLMQPYFHIEGGISGGIDLNDYLSLPLTLRGALTGLRVNHVGLNIPIDRQLDGWHCGKIEYVIETVSRIEGYIGASKKFPLLAPGLQLKVGADTVRQFIFPCDTSGSAKFFTQLGLRSAGAISAGLLASSLGVNFHSAQAAGIAGFDIAGMLIEMGGILAPERIIDIVEAVTLGADIPIETDFKVPYLGKFNALFMQRKNASLIVEHDVKIKNRQPNDVEIIHRSHPENVETDLRRRTL